MVPNRRTPPALNEQMIYRHPNISRIRFPCLAALLTAFSVSAQDLTFNCAFDSPEIRSLGNTTHVTIVECAPLQRLGAPVLPFRTLRVLLPPDSRVAGIEARLIGESAQFAINLPVEHGRTPKSPGIHPGLAQPATGPDSNIYSSDKSYPSQRAELVSVQRLAGYDIAILRVYPIQYRPVSAELIFAPNLQVKLVVDSAATPAPQRLRSGPPPKRALLDQVSLFVDNPEMLKAYPSPRPQQRLNESSACDYLLITKSNLVQSFQPLLNFKTATGLSVKLETVEAISASQPGQDTQEKIRNYLRHTYDEWGISYVLLGGDISVIPCRYASVFMGSLVPSPLLPTDLYYACLDGSWNGDGDAKWGEPDDGEGGTDVDLLAEVYVGRAPVETPAEVATFVTKTLRYATEPHVNRQNLLLLAEFLETTPTGAAQGGDMFDPLVSLLVDYKTTWLDDRFTVPEWRKQDALNAMNQSPHLVLLNGHGNDNTLIGLEKPFIRSIETADIDLLTNQWPFLAYSVGCNVGQFDNDRFSLDSIGEELVKQHSRGAFAAILNSRLGWYDDQDEAKYSGEFQTRFFSHLLSNRQTNFGMANQLGKHDLAGQIETSGIMPYRWCYYEITLFGDPHLSWQTPMPAMTVTARGTPVSWLASYGWTNAFETVDTGDNDLDGMPTWQEYVAGTSPVDASSALRVSAEAMSPTSVRLTWSSTADRLYAIWAANAPLGVSTGTLLTNNLAATPPFNAYIDASPQATSRYYRVEVKLR